MCIFFRADSLQMIMSPFYTLDYLSCAHCLCTSVYLSSVFLLLTCCWCLVWCETASWLKLCLTPSACSVHHIMGNYLNLSEHPDAFVLHTVKMTDSCLCFCNRLALSLNQLRMIVTSALLLIIAVKCLLSWGKKKPSNTEQQKVSQWHPDNVSAVSYRFEGFKKLLLIQR